jgi:hypothetical protein
MRGAGKFFPAIQAKCNQNHLLGICKRGLFHVQLRQIHETGVLVTCMGLSVNVELQQWTGMQSERMSVHIAVLEPIRIVGLDGCVRMCGKYLSSTCCNLFMHLRWKKHFSRRKCIGYRKRHPSADL